MSEALTRRGQHALVIDDDPVMRLMAEQTLSTLGFEVAEAESGEEALEIVTESRFDLVLLDLELPGLDGFATCDALRKLDGGKELTIVMLTGHTDAETIQRAFEMGATDFATKPPDWALLQHRLRFLMRAHGAFAGLRETLADLNRNRNLLASAQRLARIGSWELGETGRIVASDELRRILDVSADTTISLSLMQERTHPDDREKLQQALHDAFDQGLDFSIYHRVLGSDGGVRIVQHRAELTTARPGAPSRVQGTVQDVTDRKRNEERIRQLAYYDSLTALPNRRMLTGKLERSIEFAKRTGELGALLFLDIDRFKRVNDSFGHSAGDALLKEVAERLSQTIRSTDQIGRPGQKRSIAISRLGGDEFTLLLNGIRSADDAAIVARRVLHHFEQPFEVGQRQVMTSTSIGIALFPEDGADSDAVLRNADAAMYEAKRGGRNTYRFFNASMNQKAARSMSIETALHRALPDSELSLAFQPLWSVRREAIVGVEALVRWESAELGSVSPGEFIPVAEESGLMLPIGSWVLQHACEQIAAWRARGQADIHLSANVSSQELLRPEMPERVASTLRETGLEPAALELELTETALLTDEAIVLRNLERLRELGVRLALDDFGTGYSSLSHLVEFPIDTVKIDRSFVCRLGEDRKPDAVVAAILGIAQRLNLQVVAEGVETEQQQQMLREQGCDLLQGYGIGRPVPAEALLERLTGS